MSDTSGTGDPKTSPIYQPTNLFWKCVGLHIPSWPKVTDILFPLHSSDPSGPLWLWWWARSRWGGKEGWNAICPTYYVSSISYIASIIWMLIYSISPAELVQNFQFVISSVSPQRFSWADRPRISSSQSDAALSTTYDVRITAATGRLLQPSYMETFWNKIWF